MRNPPESSIAPPDAVAPAPSRMSTAFVVCAMTLVALALATGLHLQLAMNAMHAVAAAAFTWLGLLALHFAVGRAQRRVPAERRAPVQKPRPDLGRLAASPAVQRRRQPELASEPPPLPATAARSAVRTSGQGDAAQEQGTERAVRPGLDDTGAAPRALGWDVRPGTGREPLATTPKPAVFPPLEQTVSAALKANALGGRQAGGEHDASAVGARPAQRAVAGGLDGKPPPMPPRVPVAETAAADASVSKSSEIQSMQTVIDQLARQLNTPVEAGGATEQSASITAVSEEEDAEQALARSIEALKAASGAMRDVVATPRPMAREKRHAAGNPAASVDPGTSRIAAAIAANQYEVYLDSIAGLADHKTRHFEITLRVKTENGPAPDAEDCAALLGSGAGTRLDAAKLVRVAQIASRLSSRGATAALFARLMPESLVDDMVLETCAEIVGRDAAVGRQLVLSFRQAAVRAFTKDHWETLATLSENGLRFAVEELSDLAMDFDVLKERGFHFVKADSAALLAGMQAHDGIISPEEACRRFTATGLSVIVGGVLDDATVAWALGLGAPYGQGALFSAPRPVKDLGAQQDAAA
jgi:cyclic-di-GMP phosphodiesterase TipF (flagellum assembly factor)